METGYFYIEDGIIYRKRFLKLKIGETYNDRVLGNLSNPSQLDFMTYVLTDKSIKELKVIKYKHFKSEETKTCLCSKKNIYNICIVRPRAEPDNRFAVGCCCIQKYGSQTQVKKLNSLVKKYKDRLKLKEKFKKCTDCREYNILKSKPSWTKRCLGCYLTFKYASN